MTSHHPIGGTGRAQERGAALVELAVALPMLVLLMLGTADFARIFYMTMTLSEAARAGAQYGAQSVTKSRDTAGMRTAATNAVAADNLSGFSVTATTACVCWNDAGSTSQAPSPNTCAGTCAGGYHLVVNVTVTATGTFTTVANYPGIPHTLTLSRDAVMRAQ
jgi:Flp pilus assembly protein TadG